MKTIRIAAAPGVTERQVPHKNRGGLTPCALIDGPESWTQARATRATMQDRESWTFDGVPLHPQLVSHPFTLEQGKLYTFSMDVQIDHAAPMALVLIPAQANPSDPDSWIRCRAQSQSGAHRLGFSMAPEVTGVYQLALINYFGNYVRGSTLSFTSWEVMECPHTHVSTEDVDTYLAHWGPIKRYIHRRCKRSRMFNAFVAGMEMRLGREESLSLPMYLALCPTGQCNALCDFCSVTIKRTGIIKKQLPIEKLQRFLEPTLNTAFMYGMEGNGEPTLYKEFNSLLATLRARGADAYLITNGALIEREQISHLLSLQSITFSLNAATADTHRKVMKLKEFSKVTENIRAIVAQRGMQETPAVFVSFVVHSTNAHELQQFLQFAEHELGVNVIMVRPLSELGVDTGAVEDLREIVPYESQVRDALDAAREYLHDVPRRPIPHTQFACDIRLDPSTFRSVRPDPLDRIVMPPGFEDRLLAPRRDGWRALDSALSVTWRLNIVTLHSVAETAGHVVWRSVATPVTPGKTLTFCATIRLTGASIMLSIRDADGKALSSRKLLPSEQTQDLVLAFETGDASQVTIDLAQDGAFDAQIDFLRLLTPGPGIRKEFKLPYPRRWQIDSPGVKAAWRGTVLQIQSGPDRAGKYLFKSYSNPCPPNARLRLPVHVEVTSGTLAIGVLSEDFQRWTHQFAFEPGTHERELEIDTQDNQRLQVVLFARGNSALSAFVDWQGNLESPPDRETTDSTETFDVLGPTSDAPSPDNRDGDGPRTSAIPKVAKPVRIKVYCQKPWTDINNFTVDGRMDVCCITTGSSQEHYALGNIMQQSFQEIWNGAKMREFRRTVNSPNPLPPCQRCPMAYSYQGPFFDRNLAEAAIEKKFGPAAKRSTLLQELHRRAVHNVLRGITDLFFRGFRK